MYVSHRQIAFDTTCLEYIDIPVGVRLCRIGFDVKIFNDDAHKFNYV